MIALKQSCLLSVKETYFVSQFLKSFLHTVSVLTHVLISVQHILVFYHITESAFSWVKNGLFNLMTSFQSSRFV